MGRETLFASRVTLTELVYKADRLAAAALLFIEDERALDEEKKCRAKDANGVLKETLHGDVLSFIKTAIEERSDAQPSEPPQYALLTTPSLTMNLVCILLSRGSFADPSVLTMPPASSIWKALIASAADASFCLYREENEVPAGLPLLVASEIPLLLNHFKKGLEANYLSLTPLEISQFARLLACMPSSEHVAYLLNQYPTFTIKGQYQQIHQMYMDLMALSFSDAQYGQKAEQILNDTFPMLKYLVERLPHKEWSDGAAKDSATASKKETFKQEYERLCQIISLDEWNGLDSIIQAMKGRLVIQYGNKLEENAIVVKIRKILEAMEKIIRPYRVLLPGTYKVILGDEVRATSPSSPRKGRRDDVVPPLFLEKMAKAASSSSPRAGSPLSSREPQASPSAANDTVPSVATSDAREAGPQDTVGERSRSKSLLDKLKEKLS